MMLLKQLRLVVPIINSPRQELYGRIKNYTVVSRIIRCHHELIFRYEISISLLCKTFSPISPKTLITRHCYMSNTVNVWYELGTASHSRAPVFTHGFVFGPSCSSFYCYIWQICFVCFSSFCVPMSPMSLDCQLLIVSLVFSNIYLFVLKNSFHTFLFKM